MEKVKATTTGLLLRQPSSRETISPVSVHRPSSRWRNQALFRVRIAATPWPTAIPSTIQRAYTTSAPALTAFSAKTTTTLPQPQPRLPARPPQRSNHHRLRPQQQSSVLPVSDATTRSCVVPASMEITAATGVLRPTHRAQRGFHVVWVGHIPPTHLYPRQQQQRSAASAQTWQRGALTTGTTAKPAAAMLMPAATKAKVIRWMT